MFSFKFGNVGLTRLVETSRKADSRLLWDSFYLLINVTMSTLGDSTIAERNNRNLESSDKPFYKFVLTGGKSTATRKIGGNLAFIISRHCSYF